MAGSITDRMTANVRRLMTEAGWTQSELAKRSGVSQTAISKMLRGEMTPTIEVAEKIASAFGLSGWHIIMPNLEEDQLLGRALERLFQDFLSASKDGRDFILQVAAREAKAQAKSGV